MSQKNELQRQVLFGHTIQAVEITEQEVDFEERMLLFTKPDVQTRIFPLTKDQRSKQRQFLVFAVFSLKEKEQVPVRTKMRPSELFRRWNR